MVERRETDGLRLAGIAGRVRLTTEQVARLCGVSRRQLSYWVQRGIIPVEGSYPVDAVEKVLLIKRELDSGRSLKQAIQSIDSFLAGRQAWRQALLDMSHEELREAFAQGLGQLATLIEGLGEVVAAESDAQALRTLSARLDRLHLETWLREDARALSLQAQVGGLEQMVGWLGRWLEELRSGRDATGAGPWPAGYQIDEDEVLGRLTLNATEAAQVCGVTVRQLTYWTDKGIIPTVAGESRSYGPESLRKALLIRQAMGMGYTLEKGVAAVEARLAEEARARAEADARPGEMLREELGRRLGALGEAVAELRGRLPTHFALTRFRSAAAALDRPGVETRLRAGLESDPGVVEFVRLVEVAADHLERALAGLGGGNGIQSNGVEGREVSAG